MKEPRVFLRTHYQVSRPGIFSALVARCTTASQSRPPDTVADRLYNEFRTSFHKLSKRAAEEAVTMAQGYGFITQGNFWTWKGSVLNYFSRDRDQSESSAFLSLSPDEILIHLKYYLEAQGAIAIQFANHLLEHGSASEIDLKEQTFLEGWLGTAFRWCAGLSSSIPDRVRLKERAIAFERPSGRYGREVRWHKLAPIVWPLVDFHLIEASYEGRTRHFKPVHNESLVPLANLLSRVGSYEKLEASIEGESLLLQEWLAIGGSVVSGEPAISGRVVAEAYRSIRLPPAETAAIEALADVCAIVGLRSGVWLGRAWLDKNLDELRLRFPSDVSFHYDRAGKRSQVVLGKSALSYLESQDICVNQQDALKAQEASAAPGLKS